MILFRGGSPANWGKSQARWSKKDRTKLKPRFRGKKVSEGGSSVREVHVSKGKLKSIRGERSHAYIKSALIEGKTRLNEGFLEECVQKPERTKGGSQ